MFLNIPHSTLVSCFFKDSLGKMKRTLLNGKGGNGSAIWRQKWFLSFFLESFKKKATWQVFWLTPGAPSLPMRNVSTQWPFLLEAAVCLGAYSSGTVQDLHLIPFWHPSNRFWNHCGSNYLFVEMTKSDAKILSFFYIATPKVLFNYH